MNKVFILAGTADQARSLARWHDMAPSEWAYVFDINVIRGLRQLTLWLYGTWYQRPDVDETIAMARHAGFKIFAIDDEGRF